MLAECGGSSIESEEEISHRRARNTTVTISHCDSEVFLTILSQKIVFFTQNALRRAIARARRRRTQWRAACADRGGSSGVELSFLF
jgi:hypothetical protein